MWRCGCNALLQAQRCAAGQQAFPRGQTPYCYPTLPYFHVSLVQEIVDEDLSQMHAREKELRSAGSPTAAQARSRREGNAEKTL